MADETPLSQERLGVRLPGSHRPGHCAGQVLLMAPGHIDRVGIEPVGSVELVRSIGCFAMGNTPRGESVPPPTGVSRMQLAFLLAWGLQ